MKNNFSNGQYARVNLNGLSIYKVGKGEPILLMPYPHASAYHPMIENPLVNIFTGMGYAVLTFDPPGIYNSAREASVDLDEMYACTNEVLKYYDIKDSIHVVGHSQSGFCALGYAIEFPEKVKKLILIGAVSGWPMIKKSSIHKQFGWFTRERWKMMYWGTRKMIGMSNLYIHKQLDQLVENNSYYNKKFVDTIPVSIKERKIPEPPRARWMINLRKYNYDYSNELDRINVPVLIVVGKHDPQTPVEASLQLKEGIKNATMHVFPESGHSPYLEERERFKNIVIEWLK